MTPTDIITALGGTAGIVAIIKAFMTARSTSAITEDRKVSKENYDARFATLEEHQKQQDQRLDEGDDRMGRIESRHLETEALLQEIRANVAYIKGRIETAESRK